MLIQVYQDTWGQWTTCNKCGTRVRWAQSAHGSRRMMFESDVSLKTTRDAQWRNIDHLDEKDRHTC